MFLFSRCDIVHLFIFDIFMVRFFFPGTLQIAQFSYRQDKKRTALPYHVLCIFFSY